jgi:DUF4097 and DUF4098 domain-containing protein YvlB
MRLRRIRAQAARREDRQDAGLTSVILALFAGLLAAAIAATPALSAERFELRGAHVAIYNLAGEVTLEPGSGPAVVVHVSRGGNDAGELDVQTGTIGDLETLRVIYPSRRVHYRRGAGSWGSSTTVRVGKDGRFGDRDGRLSRDRVTISGGSGLDAHANMRVEVPRGQTLGLYLAVGEATANNTEGDLRIDVSAADVTTGGTRGDLVIDVGSGAVQVSGAEGSVNVDTGSGSVDLLKIRGDELLVDTGSGHVSAADVDVRRLLVDTGSGGVDLGMVKAREVMVDTGSGHVTIDLTSDVESLNVDTGSGGVTVRMPGTVGAEITVDTGSGGIRSDLPIEVIRKDRDTLRGRIGDGRGRILIETGSGGVRLLSR